MSGVGPKTANTYQNASVPSNYVAGVGRGAMGFTTRSDIGPARPAGAPTATGAVPTDPQFGQAPAGYVAGMGRGMGELARGQGEIGGSATKTAPDDGGDYSESNYDEFSGYGEKLFTSGTPYDEDDVEADRIYGQVDDLMDSRRKRSREKQLLEQQKKSKSERPRIADQFADLKRQLSEVTMEEWESIPEVGDHSLKLKQSRKKETFTPLPDYMIESSGSLGAIANSLNPAGMDTPNSFLKFGANGTQSTMSGLAAEARGNALSLKLDKMSDSVTGQTVVDPKGYLTNLNSIKVTSEAEIGDIKKARILLSSVTTTNPKHGPGWIAAARVEEFAGKMSQARKIIIQGCETCPESEDVWLEAARLHNSDKAKTILANAVLHLPTSVKIWICAADLEEQESRKKAVLRRSLEFVPNSVKLWKSAIELENVSDARIMLARAVECVPHSVEMWLALAKLETHENARKVLNSAREANPTERATWITAAKLEEANGNGHLVARIIEKMIVSLTQYQVTIDREQWLKEAEDCEHAGAVLTGAAIIRNTIHLGVEDEDRKNTWMDDAETCLSHDPISKETARAIYNYALEIFPSKKSLWLAAAMLEKEHGTFDSLEAKLKEGVKYCPQAEVLWLMAAKEKWMSGDVPGARAVLLEAFDVNPKSEQIWLAAVKLEWENNELIRARLLLSRARDRAPSERVWLKSALLEREMGEHVEELKLLDEAIQKYPTFFKFYLMAGQTSDSALKDPVKARNYYTSGLKLCPNCVPLWCHLMQLEERVKGAVKARPTGEMARMKLPGNDLIWLECIRLERRSNNEKLAENLMAKALQECPKSGILWAEDILTCRKPLQKSKSIDALKKCDNDPIVLIAVARLFEKDNKIAKARKWFDRAVSLSPRLGDGWAYYYTLELSQENKRLIDSNNSDNIVMDISSTSNDANNNNNLTVDIEDGDDALEMTNDTMTTSNNDTLNLSNGEKMTDIICQRCVGAQPNRGELWCSIAKETKMRHADITTILKTIAERLLSKNVN
eukprot:gene8362-11314_t